MTEPRPKRTARAVVADAWSRLRYMTLRPARKRVAEAARVAGRVFVVVFGDVRDWQRYGGLAALTWAAWSYAGPAAGAATLGLGLWYLDLYAVLYWRLLRPTKKKE